MTTNYINLRHIPIFIPTKGSEGDRNVSPLADKEPASAALQINLSRVITEEITLESRPPSSSSPVLNTRSRGTASDFSLSITDLIFLLKKLDQIALKQSADGMINAQSSVNSKATSIRQEGIYNCSAAVAGGITQIAVMGASYVLSAHSLRKQKGIDGAAEKIKQDGISQIGAKRDKNIADINEKYKPQLDEIHPKIDNEYGGALSRPIREERDGHIKNENANFELEKAKLENQRNALSNDDKKRYMNASLNVEKYRTLGQLSHSMGNMISSSVSIGASEERAKSSLAEMSSSVENKVTDYNRERSNNYKNTASELINSMNRILENISNTIGEIARKC
jgi:hypothetical protein